MFKETFILIALLCAQMFIAEGRLPLPSNNQDDLTSLFISSRIAQSNPMQSLACFSDYIDESNDISEKYSNDYNECLIKASIERDDINAEALEERREIETSAEDVCTRIRNCNSNNNALGMLECHAKLGPKNTKSCYTISGNASEYAALLQERYRLVELRHEQCCAAIERVYVQSSAINYNQLQSCLDGKTKPRPPKTTTTTERTTSSTAIMTTETSTPPPTTPKTASTPPPTTTTTTDSTPPPTTTTTTTTASTLPPTTTTDSTPPPTTTTTTTTASTLPPTTTTDSTSPPTTTTPASTPPPTSTTSSTPPPTTTSSTLPTTTTQTLPPTTSTAPQPPTTATPEQPLITVTATPTETKTLPPTTSAPTVIPISSTLDPSAETILPSQTFQEQLVKLLNSLN